MSEFVNHTRRRFLVIGGLLSFGSVLILSFQNCSRGFVSNSNSLGLGDGHTNVTNTTASAAGEAVFSDQQAFSDGYTFINK
jgi:hypothetical protein